nr:MAG TPA: hypothetical protein [Crassvirales sp.]
MFFRYISSFYIHKLLLLPVLLKYKLYVLLT